METNNNVASYIKHLEHTIEELKSNIEDLKRENDIQRSKYVDLKDEYDNVVNSDTYKISQCLLNIIDTRINNAYNKITCELSSYIDNVVGEMKEYAFRVANNIE